MECEKKEIITKYSSLRCLFLSDVLSAVAAVTPGGAGGTPYNGLYWEAPPERGTFLTLQVYERGRNFTNRSV